MYTHYVLRIDFSDKPELPPSQRGEFYGFISGVTNITCEARAEPPAQFKWLDKNNEDVKEGTIVNEEHKSTLMVRQSVSGIARSFLCNCQICPGNKFSY